MEMTHVACGRTDADRQTSEEEPVAELLEIMAELSEVLVVENELLHRGLPASLVEMSERKATLTDEYTEAAEDLVAHHLPDLTANPAWIERLGEAGGRLQSLTAENLCCLETALDATRRRIEAVMRAVRNCQASEQAALEHFVGYDGEYQA